MSRAEREFHRKTAVAAFNSTWDYLDEKDRSAEDEIQMIQLAHASRYHWGLVGTPRNKAVGDWQISRVYAELGQPELALRYAKLSLSACRKHRLREVLPTAYEAMARAYAVAGDSKNAVECLTEARRILGRLSLGEEDRSIYSGQIEDTQRLIDGV